MKYHISQFVDFADIEFEHPVVYFSFENLFQLKSKIWSEM